MSPQPQVERPGLRERKKARTRATIQRHALRLFREQGYEATTVDQIAEAAEVSPSTFFRYFPTKEEVVLWDDLDPLLIAIYEAQPAELGPIPALRAALREVFTRLPAEDLEGLWERTRLILSIPELRMRILDQFTVTNNVMAEMVAKRTGRQADDFAVRCFAGALLGVLFATLLSNPFDLQTNYLELMDASLAYLEAGMPL